MEQILIKNFKSIKNKNEKYIQINQFTIFFGEQASGKSTVAKLIYFFKTIPNELFFEVLQNYNDINNVNINEILTKRLRKYFVILFGATRHLQDFEIIYTYASTNQLHFKKNHLGSFDITNKEDNWKNIIVLCVNIANQLKQLKKTNRLEDQLTYEAELQRIRASFLQQLKKIFDDRTVVFMPASRNITVSLEHHLTKIYSEIDKSLISSPNSTSSFESENEYLIMQFIKHANYLKDIFSQSGSFQGLVQDEISIGTNVNSDVVDKILEKMENIIKGKYSFDEYGEKIYFNNKEYVFIGNSSSGQQEVIRLIQDIFVSIIRQEKTCKIYEEPESHLFPSAQKILLELLVMLNNVNENSQLIINTHSPYLLTSLNNLLYASLSAHENPTKIEKINEVISHYERFKVNSRGKIMNFKAYFLENGEITDMVDKEEQLIDAAYLDTISEQLSTTFHKLMNIRYE